MAARQAVLLTPPKSPHPKALPFCQQSAPITPLSATLTRPPSKCCKQKTCSIPKSFKCNTYKKQGVAMLSSASSPTEARPSAQRFLCARRLPRPGRGVSALVSSAFLSTLNFQLSTSPITLPPRVAPHLLVESPQRPFKESPHV